MAGGREGHSGHPAAHRSRAGGVACLTHMYCSWLKHGMPELRGNVLYSPRPHSAGRLTVYAQWLSSELLTAQGMPDWWISKRWTCPPATKLGDAVTSCCVCRWGRHSLTGISSGGTEAHTALPSGQAKAHSLVPRRPSQVQQFLAHARSPMRASWTVSSHHPALQQCGRPASAPGLSQREEQIEAVCCVTRRAAGVRGLHIPRHWGAGCCRVWSDCSQLPGPSLGPLEDA